MDLTRLRISQFYKCILALLYGTLMVEGQIMTVNGPIKIDSMGMTLIHEHIMVDWVGADSSAYHRWDRDDIVLRALPLLKEAKKYGVKTFIDCTPAFLGRDPYILKRLSDSTGLNILTNTGYYGAQNNKFVPEHAFELSERELAELWINEFKNGIDSSGIRPGFIKISVDKEGNLSKMHEKLIKAAALAHLETGLAIVSHTGPDAPALSQLNALLDMGVSPNAFIWTHAQGGTLNGYIQAAKLGAWISLDHVGAEPERISWYVNVLSQLKNQRLLQNVLISHDSGWYNVGQANGGNFRPYTALFTHLIPELKQRGWTQKEIDLLIRENPKRAYALTIRTYKKT